MPPSYAFAQSRVDRKCLAAPTHILLHLGWKGKAIAQSQAYLLGSSFPPCPGPPTPLSQQPVRSAVWNSSFMLPAFLCLCQTPASSPSTLVLVHVSVTVHLSVHKNLSLRHSVLVSPSIGTQRLLLLLQSELSGL